MKEQFAIAVIGSDGETKTLLQARFDTYRHAVDWWEEFWGGPYYAIMHRFVTDWEPVD